MCMSHTAEQGTWNVSTTVPLQGKPDPWSHGVQPKPASPSPDPSNPHETHGLGELHVQLQTIRPQNKGGDSMGTMHRQE